MEDRSICTYGVQEPNDFLLVGVFDGHGGVDAVEHVQSNLLSHFEKPEVPSLGTDVNGAIEQVFVNMDNELRTENIDAGTTAVIALIDQNQIIVANLGDSRCVLSREERQYPLSTDHKPHKRTEARRALKAGYRVTECAGEPARILSGDNRMALAVSRTLGDFEFKNSPDLAPQEQAVSCVPEILVQNREPTDEFMVLASDGLWDVFQNWDVVRFIHSHLRTYRRGYAAACEALVQECIRRGTVDNITVVLVNLQPEEDENGDATTTQRHEDVPKTDSKDDAAVRSVDVKEAVTEPAEHVEVKVTSDDDV